MSLKINRAAIAALMVASLLVAPAVAEKKFQTNITISAGKVDRLNAPVKMTIALPSDLADARTAMVLQETGKVLLGQLTPPGLLGEELDLPKGHVARELHFVVGSLEAGESRQAEVIVQSGGKKPQPQFTWNDTVGKSLQLNFGDRPVLRYMYETLDETSKERRMETYKPYHHVFDPLGKRLMTKGPGGLYPHHRGLYYGFNKISYGQGQTADVWHCNKGESQSHESVLSSAAGPVLGRHRLAIDWRGKDGKVFAHEQREMSVYHTPGGLTIEFASRLTSCVGHLTLKGDPQHAGFQFRASQDVPDKTKQLTYYIRPDGRDKPGSFRNWPADKGHINLPFNAMSIVLDSQRYTVCYLDSPQNPKPARYSERDYGRFGSYFEYELADNQQRLDLHYRVWLQQGEMSVEEVTAQSRNFVDPPSVSLR